MKATVRNIENNGKREFGVFINENLLTHYETTEELIECLQYLVSQGYDFSLEC